MSANTTFTRKNYFAIFKHDTQGEGTALLSADDVEHARKIVMEMYGERYKNMQIVDIYDIDTIPKRPDMDTLDIEAIMNTSRSVN